MLLMGGEHGHVAGVEGLDDLLGPSLSASQASGDGLGHDEEPVALPGRELVAVEHGPRYGTVPGLVTARVVRRAGDRSGDAVDDERAGLGSARGRSRGARRVPPRRRRSGRRRRRAARATAGPGHLVADLGQATMPAVALTGSSLRARPAPRRQAATPTALASRRRTKPAVGAGTVRTSALRERRVGVAALRPDHARPHRRRPDRASTAAGSASGGRRARASRGRGRGSPRRRRPGRRPASTSTDSVDLEPVARRPRPSGWSMSVSRATVRTPFASPRPTIVSASRARRRASGRNAPAPTLTSSTSASVPSAIFFDMIDDAMSGIASTVPVTSRRA